MSFVQTYMLQET